MSSHVLTVIYLVLILLAHSPTRFGRMHNFVETVLFGVDGAGEPGGGRWRGFDSVSTARC